MRESPSPPYDCTRAPLPTHRPPIRLGLQGELLELVPRIDRQVCLRTRSDDGVGESALPDVTGWEWGGEVELEGAPAELWTYEAR